MALVEKLIDGVRNLIGRRRTSVRATEVVLSDLEYKLACLRKEVEGRDRAIEQMRREYERLQESLKGIESKTRGDATRIFLSSFANRLSLLVVLACGIKDGKQIDVKEIADQILALEKELAGYGLEPVGRPGEKVKYDVRVHQGMGSDLIEDGEEVVVRIPGYKYENQILIKAYISRV
ncbi:MAG: hypothetical protein ACPMAG_04445 [Limisphaerales bacterium]